MYCSGPGLVVGQPVALIGHLEKQQVGKLLDVVAVRHVAVAKDIAVVPGLLGNIDLVHENGSFRVAELLASCQERTRILISCLTNPTISHVKEPKQGGE